MLIYMHTHECMRAGVRACAFVITERVAEAVREE